MGGATRIPTAESLQERFPGFCQPALTKIIARLVKAMLFALGWTGTAFAIEQPWQRGLLIGKGGVSPASNSCRRATVCSV